jgi:hypothetical protein
MVLANDPLFGTSAGCELHTQRTARSHPTYEVEDRSPILLPLNLKCRLFLHITPSSGASSLECDKEFSNSHQTTPETRQNIRRIRAFLAVGCWTSRKPTGERTAIPAISDTACVRLPGGAERPRTMATHLPSGPRVLGQLLPALPPPGGHPSR